MNRTFALCVSAAVFVVPALLTNCVSSNDESPKPPPSPTSGSSSGGSTSSSSGGSSTSSSSGGSSTSSSSSGGTDSGADADAAPVDAGDSCDFGDVVGDEQGNVKAFYGGNAVPAGKYRISYVKGCFKYAGTQSWAVHAYEPSATGTVADSTWALVGAATSDVKMVKLPGTVGFSTYATFAECVTANQALAAVEYDHAGGALGIWLYDTIYTDNVAGENGENPTWRLHRIGTASCP